MIKLLRLLGKIEHRLLEADNFPSVVLLAVRLWLGQYFFSSGLTKIGSFETAKALFADEYKVPLLDPTIATYLATAAELSLPVLLAFGFLTRYAALGLLGMLMVIEFFVYPGTKEHYHYGLMALTIIAFGSGRFGLDRWLHGRP